MIARQRIVKEKVDRILHVFPPSRGDDTLLQLRFWATEQPDCVEAIVFYLRYYREGKRHQMPNWVMEKIMQLTAAETIRRRREEIQADAEARVEAQLAQLKLTEKEMKASRDVLRAMTHVLPTKRVRDKRIRLEDAMQFEFGNGYKLPDQRMKLSLLDFEV
jgi:hypothetical protein